MTMFSRQLILLKSIKCNDVMFSYRRVSHKFNRQTLRRFPDFRFIATKKTPTSKTLPILIGTATIGGIGAYVYFNKSTAPGDSPKDVDIDDIPFVNEHLDEDLNLLKAFGKIPYLLVGSGSASFAAYRAIRTADPNAKVLMIGDEPIHPYMRPPLSKEMWFDPKEDNIETLNFTTWDGKSRSLLYEPPDYYFTVKEILENQNGGVSVIRGVKVVKVDPVSQVVYLENGGEISYEKCLLATGSKPKNMPLFEKADNAIKKHITLFRTIQDFKKLNKICKKAESIVIVGGGFLGSELACGIVRQRGKDGLKTIQIFPESGIMGKYLPEYLSKWTSKKLSDDGIKIIPEVSVEKVFTEENKLVLQLSNNESIKTDHVVVAVGSDANTDIAKASGLEVDEKTGGFVVNTEMEARKNLWIAGDASCFYDTVLGRRRVEHHDHAVVSGGLAGKNMTGSGSPYWHQSMFWSDLGPDIGFEAIGIVDSSLPTVGIFMKNSKSNKAISREDNITEMSSNKEKEDMKTVENVSQNSEVNDEQPRTSNQSDNYDKGIIFYLRNDVIVGIVLWNIFAKMSIARKIINESKSYDNLQEVAKLFELNSIEE